MSRTDRSNQAATHSDHADPVGDEIWAEAACHYDEPALAALIIAIATVNVWNRLNGTTREIAGEWATSADTRRWVEDTGLRRAADNVRSWRRAR